MSHIDDGRLNALLDGELSAAEADEVRKHIAECVDCAKRLDEATRFLTGAADLLGALDLPATAHALPPAAPERRVPKTAREVAIDLDGATHKSPAVRPNIVEPPPTARRRFDLSTLSWAAMVVLAIGVGYLANEVRHSGFGLAGREAPGVTSLAPTPAASPAARTTGPATAGSPTAAAPRRTLRRPFSRRAAAPVRRSSPRRAHPAPSRPASCSAPRTPLGASSRPPPPRRTNWQPRQERERAPRIRPSRGAWRSLPRRRRPRSALPPPARLSST